MKDSTLFKENYNLYLKQQMMLNGITLHSLAEKTGYSYEGVRQILKGKGSYRGVYKICDALKINMSKLLNDKILDVQIN